MKKTKTKMLVLVNYKSGHSIVFFAKAIKHTQNDFSYEIDEDITSEDIERAKELIKGKNTYLVFRTYRLARDIEDIESSFIIDSFEVPLLEGDRV